MPRGSNESRARPFLSFLTFHIHPTTKQFHFTSSFNSHGPRTICIAQVPREKIVCAGDEPDAVAVFFASSFISFPYAHAKKKISTNGLSVPQPHKPIISSPDWLGAGCSEDTSSNPTSTTRSHHSLTRREVFQNLANRIIYSKFYMVLYLVLAVLSVWSIFLSFNQGCASSPLFVILESIINCSMIAEVGLRLTALGKVRKSQIVPTLGSDDSYHNYSNSFFSLIFRFLALE